MARAKLDPMIAVLIEKLPKAGETWTQEQQFSWLRLMAMVFGSVYGGNVAEVYGANPVKPIAPTPAKPTTIPHRFIIDEKGYAKNAAGKRILAKDAGTVPIFDTRGEEGDMRSIIWADDSKGLNGADVVITA